MRPRAGHTLIDRRLYLPKDWCEDPQRRAAAGVPDDVEFATKPALATQMITAALDAGMPAGWAAGDEVYGADPELRQTLQQRGIGYVLGIGANRTVSTGVGAERVDVLTASLPRHAWQHRSAGVGAKGRPLVFLGAHRHHRQRRRQRRGWSASSAGASQR